MGDAVYGLLLVGYVVYGALLADGPACGALLLAGAAAYGALLLAGCYVLVGALLEFGIKLATFLSTLSPI